MYAHDIPFKNPVHFESETGFKNPAKYLEPSSIADLSTLHHEMSKAKDKQRFLKDSLSITQAEILSTQQDIQNIRDKTDKVHQKSAILYLITLQYHEKTALLNSFHCKLSTHFSDGIYKQNAKLNIENTIKKTHSKHRGKSTSKIEYLLPQTQSLVVKKFKNPSATKIHTFNLQKNAEQVFKDVLMSDMLIVLKEFTKMSYANIIKILSENMIVKSTNNSQKRNSEKLLQKMKLNYIACNFSVKKLNNDIYKLCSEKESLLTLRLKSSEDQYQLLNKIAENEALNESIRYLEETLKQEQVNIKLLKETISLEPVTIKDIEAMQNKFYSDFDMMCLLQKSVPNMLDYILRCFMDLHKFANEEVFSEVSPTLLEYPHELKSELTFEIEILWNILKKKNIIKSMLQEPLPIEQSIPDVFWNLIDMAQFQNLLVVCQNIRSIKNYVSSNQKMELEYDEKRLSEVHQQYHNLVDTLIKMKTELNKCDKELESGLFLKNAVEIAFQEWWEQNAQHVANIEYEDKTLKMWQDILSAI
ncbi:uncharacterized protein CEXT_548721 [Caerostris extrusa]|uniref:Uncharacterized protein n=1 Tax=Caerostris extrusa TaxID=172846 RepID=A0AAV4P328_CAEEX|nr:uncharacterized protein CEXT_548721 [Caerostris extrusa]